MCIVWLVAFVALWVWLGFLPALIFLGVPFLLLLALAFVFEAFKALIPERVWEILNRKII